MTVDIKTFTLTCVFHFQTNKTFSEFRYLAKGGVAGWDRTHCSTCEPGAAGTVFIYHLHHKHRTLIIDNDGNDHPYNTVWGYPYVYYEDHGVK